MSGKALILSVFVILAGLLNKVSLLELNTKIKFVKPRTFECNYGSEPLLGIIQSHLYKKHNDYINVKYLDCCYLPIEVNNTHVNVDNNCVRFDNSIEVDSELMKVMCRINSSVIYEDFFWKKSCAESTSKKPKVMIIVLSKLSRDRLHRIMPKTVNYLKYYIKATEFTHLQGYSFRGEYNLFGHLFIENLWIKYIRAGYKLAYGEDCSTNTSRFQFDYDYTKIFDFLEQNFGHVGRGCPLCLGSTKTHNALLQFARKLINFPIPILSVTRINVLKEFQFGVRDLDSDFLQFFSSIFRRLSKDTILIFMGDGNVLEGLRNWGGSEQVANSAPFLFVSLHDKKGRKFPSDNTDNMITYGDIYATLIDLLGPDASTYYAYNERRSLFASIPRNRTCLELNIDPAVCLE